MGTAVLLPHDCLRNSKSRHKGHLSEANFHSERSLRGRRGTLQASVLSDPSTVCSDHSWKNTLTARVEWTPKSTLSPLLNNGSESLQLQKALEWRKFEASKSFEVKETKSASTSVCDVPAFSILQRPKTKEAADALIAKFLVQVEGEKLVDGQLNQKQESSEIPDVIILTVDKPKLKSDILPKSSGMKLSRCNLKKGACIMSAEDLNVLDFSLSGTKFADKAKSYISETSLKAGKGQSRSVALGAAQPINIPRRGGSQQGFDDVLHLKGSPQVASLKATSESKNVKKAGLIESNRSKHFPQTQPKILASTVPDGLLRLERSATDPQVVKQLAGHYRSEVVDIPCSEAKSYFGFARTAYMSCPERWAGPAYYSSPAPSSLPLPKFSFRNQRIPSFQSSGEGHTSNILESPGSEISSLESSPLQGGSEDVAFATKSLRRMLKLDPF